MTGLELIPLAFIKLAVGHQKKDRNESILHLSGHEFSKTLPITKAFLQGGKYGYTKGVQVLIKDFRVHFGQRFDLC
jgi:hypothetical protein